MASPPETPPEPLRDATLRGLTSASGSMIMATKKFIGAVEDEWTLFSDRASDYTIGEPIGYGASSIVYAATYHPPATDPNNLPAPIPCALKVLDLDSLPRRSLQLLQRETTLMSLSKHPNVLRVRGSWVDGHKLYIALRLMNKGSAADVMRYGWPGGMEEDVVRCILRQALKGLNYLHINGFIHRDIKAANLLIDDDGTVLLGDLGVAADLSEDSSHHMLANSHSGRTYSVTATAALNQMQQRRSVAFDGNCKSRPKIGKRKSFVGTPCWMAPELIEGKQYDCAADIWSFGITALELCQGRPPRSREPPKDVLLRIIHDAPPTLDREGGAYKYSRAFKEMVDSCLVKDPSKRPTAAQLLQTPFFKGAKKKSYLINTILKDLPPLTQRQERRAARHPPTVATIDSWDFATTVHSPASTIHYRRRGLEDHIPHPTEEKSEEVFHFEEDNKDLRREGGRPSSTASSSSEGNVSTDTAERGLSTPPTNPSSFVETPPSPTLLKTDPVTQPPSVPRSEESVKKSFWSRVASNVRRRTSSFKGTISPLIPNLEYANDLGRTSSNSGPKQAAPEPKEVLDGSPGKGLMKQTRPLKHSATRPKTADGTLKRPATSQGIASATNGGSWGEREGRNGLEGNHTVKVKRPGSRGSLLGGMIGEARSKLSTS